MSDIERKRVIMLAVSGLLLGATVFGWVRYIDSTSPGRDGGDHLTAGQPTSAQAGAAGGVSAGNVPAAGNPSPAPESALAGGMMPASKPVEVGLIARRSAGRPNPMADLGLPYAPGQYRRYGQSPPAGVDVPLPPPPDPAISHGGQVQPYNPPQRPLPPLKEAIRLVGVMDGKAIFTLPSDVAAENGVTPSFTLGQGQKYAGITVQEIKTHSVTVSDGKSICTKELCTLN